MRSSACGRLPPRRGGTVTAQALSGRPSSRRPVPGASSIRRGNSGLRWRWGAARQGRSSGRCPGRTPVRAVRPQSRRGPPRPGEPGPSAPRRHAATASSSTRPAEAGRRVRCRCATAAAGGNCASTSTMRAPMRQRLSMRTPRSRRASRPGRVARTSPMPRPTPVLSPTSSTRSSVRAGLLSKGWTARSPRA